MMLVPFLVFPSETLFSFIDHISDFFVHGLLFCLIFANPMSIFAGYMTELSLGLFLC